MYKTASPPDQPRPKLTQGLFCSSGLQPVLGVQRPARPLSIQSPRMATLTQPVVMLVNADSRCHREAGCGAG